MKKISAKKFNFLGQTIEANFFKQNKFLIGGLILGLILLLIGIIQLVTPKTPSSQIEIVPARAAGGPESQIEGEIVVDVAGAVAKPGVYKLKASVRVANAIEAAGNFSKNADLGWVSKSLNLAAKLQDGAKIYIPAKSEAGSSILGTSTSGTAGKININTVGQAQLESLPAVGPVTAGKIISGRPYSSVEELLTRKILGKSTFEKIKDLVSVF